MLSWRGCSWKNPTGKPGALIRETSTAMTQLGGAAGGMGGAGGQGQGCGPQLGALQRGWRVGGMCSIPQGTQAVKCTDRQTDRSCTGT